MEKYNYLCEKYTWLAKKFVEFQQNFEKTIDRIEPLVKHNPANILTFNAIMSDFKKEFFLDTQELKIHFKPTEGN